MKNYLMLNNKKIELTSEQVKEIENGFNINKIKLENVPIGDTFKVGDLEFVVLEHVQETALVVLKGFWKTSAFDGSSNNYRDSEIRKSLNGDFYLSLSKIVGEDNIVTHEVDLTSDDGRADYGSCFDNISLLTCNMYRKYVYTLDKHRNGEWWWLATPHSTKSNGYEFTVRCVDCGGALDYYVCGFGLGVRPFCILKSSIFVSK